MRFFPALLLAGLTSTAIAAPYPQNAAAVVDVASAGSGVSAVNANAAAAATPAYLNVADAKAADKGRNNGKKADKKGSFDIPIALGGGDAKQNIVFTKSAVGALDVEFANKVALTLTVTENKMPAAPPTGFKAIEPSSFKIKLAEGDNGVTLTKVGYVFDKASHGLAGIDVSKSQIGKLCTETNTFVIDAALGKQEFKDGENKVTLTTKNINGEFGIFTPDAAAGAAAKVEAAKVEAAKVEAAKVEAAKVEAAKVEAAKVEAAKGQAANGTIAGNATANAADAAKAEAAKKQAANGKAAMGDVAKAEAAKNQAANGQAAKANEGKKGAENNVKGAFDKAIATPGGNKNTNILFPGKHVGNLAVEVNVTAANAIAVNAVKPSANPPAGLLFVDPEAFDIATAKKTDTATDVVKIDYVFSAAAVAELDVTKAVIGKFDTKTKVFVIDNIGALEFKAAERKTSLTVPDLTGEWAIFIPIAAVKQQQRSSKM